MVIYLHQLLTCAQKILMFADKKLTCVHKMQILGNKLQICAHKTPICLHQLLTCVHKTCLLAKETTLYGQDAKLCTQNTNKILVWGIFFNFMFRVSRKHISEVVLMASGYFGLWESVCCWKLIADIRENLQALQAAAFVRSLLSYFLFSKIHSSGQDLSEFQCAQLPFNSAQAHWFAFTVCLGCVERQLIPFGTTHIHQLCSYICFYFHFMPQDFFFSAPFHCLLLHPHA